MHSLIPSNPRHLTNIHNWIASLISVVSYNRKKTCRILNYFYFNNMVFDNITNTPASCLSTKLFMCIFSTSLFPFKIGGNAWYLFKLGVIHYSLSIYNFFYFRSNRQSSKTFDIFINIIIFSSFKCIDSILCFFIHNFDCFIVDIWSYPSNFLTCLFKWIIP